MTTRSPGRAFVVIKVVIDTLISRAMTAVSEANPSGTGRMCSEIERRWRTRRRRHLFT